jgi:hypothetical protein
VVGIDRSRTQRHIAQPEKETGKTAWQGSFRKQRGEGEARTGRVSSIIDAALRQVVPDFHKWSEQLNGLSHEYPLIDADGFRGAMRDLRLWFFGETSSPDGRHDPESTDFCER